MSSSYMLLGSERARERKGRGAKVPGSELARVLLADLLLGANWSTSENAVNHVVVCKVHESELLACNFFVVFFYALLGKLS